MRRLVLSFSRILCLCSALITHPIFAGPIALGTQFSTFDNYVIVGLGSSDTENCTNLQAAIAAVSGVATIKLPPATYDCGSSETTIPANVRIEGSGQANTRIVSASGSSTLLLSAEAEISNLTVENDASTNFESISVTTPSGGRLTHVTLKATTAGNINNGGLVVFDTNQGEVVLNDVTIEVDNSTGRNSGILLTNVPNSGQLSNRTLILNNVDILAADTPGGSAVGLGIFIFAGSPTVVVRNSAISGVNDAIIAQGGGNTPTVIITHSELGDRVTLGGGTFDCFGAFDENRDALDATCQ